MVSDIMQSAFCQWTLCRQVWKRSDTAATHLTLIRDRFFSPSCFVLLFVVVSDTFRWYRKIGFCFVVPLLRCKSAIQWPERMYNNNRIESDDRDDPANLAGSEWNETGRRYWTHVRRDCLLHVPRHRRRCSIEMLMTCRMFSDLLFSCRTCSPGPNTIMSCLTENSFFFLSSDFLLRSLIYYIWSNWSNAIYSNSGLVREREFVKFP